MNFASMELHSGFSVGSENNIRPRNSPAMFASGIRVYGTAAVACPNIFTGYRWIECDNRLLWDSSHKIS